MVDIFRLCHQPIAAVRTFRSMPPCPNVLVLYLTCLHYRTSPFPPFWNANRAAPMLQLQICHKNICVMRHYMQYCQGHRFISTSPSIICLNAICNCMFSPFLSHVHPKENIYTVSNLKFMNQCCNQKHIHVHVYRGKSFFVFVNSTCASNMSRSSK